MFPSRFPPIDIHELCQSGLERGIVEAEGDEAAVFVEGVAEAEGVGFELGPVGAEGGGRHAEDEDAGVFQAVFDFGGDAVAGADLGFVEPDAEAVGGEAAGEVADDGFVLGAVAQEDIEFEVARHWGLLFLFILAKPGPLWPIGGGEARGNE